MHTNHSSERNFIFFAFAAHGEGISGGDRIFIELAKRWSKIATISLYVFTDGQKMSHRNGLKEDQVQLHVYTNGLFDRLGFFIQYIAKIVHSLFIAFRIRVENPKSIVCYSASDFWMDSLPAFILKRRYPEICWVASWYQTAPNPLKGFREGKREKSYRGRALIYFLVQFPIKHLIRGFADYVIVNNTDEQHQFPQHLKKQKTIVLLGAVDIDTIAGYKKKFATDAKKYDAVFQGRLHPQKGVVELVEIWHKVVIKIPDAKLVMIGDGPLMQEVKDAIKKFDLQRNIILKGYLFDGEEKYKLFAQSKLVLHPSFYDSGGMAAAEAMAFGLPCVGFDLPAYESYYPHGMVKVEKGNIHLFADSVVELLQNSTEQLRIGKEAEKMIFANYSWDQRAQEVYKQLL